ncbi:unnamed protein product [Chondrus crispus]|uniref:Uncharacterized protein n=1 Tax=Chondrus crispus TaxID=2769 RepID=R7QFF1_CHOCR|nr:unnamed protein product [Chondrus crispus]CDF36814.1 unnamed protein product [Chondrus crispus]|eukprot:XP_005716633.1 unnamed protein product [Chondrus crispus]
MDIMPYPRASKNLRQTRMRTGIIVDPNTSFSVNVQDRISHTAWERTLAFPHAPSYKREPRGSLVIPICVIARNGHSITCAIVGFTAVVYVDATMRLTTISPWSVCGANSP